MCNALLIGGGCTLIKMGFPHAIADYEQMTEVCFASLIMLSTGIGMIAFPFIKHLDTLNEKQETENSENSKTYSK